jgi:hypothetical protein
MFHQDAHIVLCGNLIAGSFYRAGAGPSAGRYHWGAGFHEDSEGGTARTPMQAKELIAAGFRAVLARAGVAERADARPRPPLHVSPPPAAEPAASAASSADLPAHDRWYDLKHPRVIDWPRRAAVKSGTHLVGLINEIATAPEAGQWLWALSGPRGSVVFWRGQATTIDEARSCVASSWAAYLDWAGLEQREPLQFSKPKLSLC